MEIYTARRDRYALSFTSGGLLLRESLLLAAEYLKKHDWVAVRSIVHETNMLQTRSSASSSRISREAIQRLQLLYLEEIRAFSDASLTEASHILWIAVCRRYSLIGEFAEEVVRERFLTFASNLLPQHFDQFMVEKSLWHSEIGEVKPSTHMKLRQNVFRMLREAGLIQHDGTIVPTILSDRVKDLLCRHNPDAFRYFPTRDVFEV